MEQFHTRVHTLKYETRFTKFLMKKTRFSKIKYSEQHQQIHRKCFMYFAIKALEEEKINEIASGMFK